MFLFDKKEKNSPQKIVLFRYFSLIRIFRLIIVVFVYLYISSFVRCIFSMTSYESEFCFKFEISIPHIEFARALTLLAATALLFVPNAIIFALII